MLVPVNQIVAAKVDAIRPRWFDLLWSARCLLCGATSQHGRDICAQCAAALPWNRAACRRCAIPLPQVANPQVPLLCGRCLQRPSPLTEAHAIFAYAFPLDRLLPRFKFHDDIAAGRLLAQWMADAFTSCDRPDALIAIPLHAARLRARGYDQALELARPLARALRIPLLIGVLTRSRATAPQSQLDAKQRHRNLRGAFTVRQSVNLPAHVVLIDDVMTTGATLHAAAKTLRHAGVQRVDAWVCARVPQNT